MNERGMAAIQIVIIIAVTIVAIFVGMRFVDKFFESSVEIVDKIVEKGQSLFKREYILDEFTSHINR